MCFGGVFPSEEVGQKGPKGTMRTLYGLCPKVCACESVQEGMKVKGTGYVEVDKEALFGLGPKLPLPWGSWSPWAPALPMAARGGGEQDKLQRLREARQEGASARPASQLPGRSGGGVGCSW